LINKVSYRYNIKDVYDDRHLLFKEKYGGDGGGSEC
jgi:hypothetical protein